MTDVNEILARLAEARAGYKDFMEAVDADLRRERQRRLAVRTGEIMNYVAEAYAAGASKRAIMRAYDTKDFRTIDSMINSMEEQIALLKAEADAKVATPEWLEVKRIDTHRWAAIIHGVQYDVIELEGFEYMLSTPPGETGDWDGIIVSGSDAVGSDAERIWFAIGEAMDL